MVDQETLSIGVFLEVIHDFFTLEVLRFMGVLASCYVFWASPCRRREMASVVFVAALMAKDSVFKGT